MNLNKVSWKRPDVGDNEEQVNLVLIPRNKWNEKNVIDAKQEELNKLATWDTYELVPDEGQEAVSTRWVIWKKDENTTRARLVARGYEEKVEVPVDSPWLLFLQKCLVILFQP